MGCATSKPKEPKICQNCQALYTPVRRSYSMHSHHLPQSPRKEKEESFHVVALTSSTLGSLKLDLLDHIHCIQEEDDEDSEPLIQNREEFVMGMFEAKTWSKTIDQKIQKIVPKTPTGTPPGEPETIDVCELMAGLENTSPFAIKPQYNHIRSFSFNLAPNRHLSFDDYPTPKIKEAGDEAIKPLWLETADDECDSTSIDTSIDSEFDPDVISTLRKALEDLPPANHFLPPTNPISTESHDGNNKHLDATDDSKKMLNGVVEFHKTLIVKEKLVVYYTSLRTVRKTYDDCCNVRLILKGLKVKVDERDVSMHSGFKDELKQLLGEEWFKGGALPKVFIGRKYIGGAEEIRQMHEEGQMEKAVEGCEMVDGDGEEGGINGGGCEGCGDLRFIPCDTCSGSCKIYYEEDEEEYEESEYGFQRCPHCNENGLIRCPICCDS